MVHFFRFLGAPLSDSFRHPDDTFPQTEAENSHNARRGVAATSTTTATTATARGDEDDGGYSPFPESQDRDTEAVTPVTNKGVEPPARLDWLEQLIFSL